MPCPRWLWNTEVVCRGAELQFETPKQTKKRLKEDVFGNPTKHWVNGSWKNNFIWKKPQKITMENDWVYLWAKTTFKPQRNSLKDSTPHLEISGEPGNRATSSLEAWLETTQASWRHDRHSPLFPLGQVAAAKMALHLSMLSASLSSGSPGNCAAKSDPLHSLNAPGNKSML